MAENKIENRLQIRHGNTIPSSDNLLQDELGFCDSEKYSQVGLYIKNQEGKVVKLCGTEDTTPGRRLIYVLDEIFIFKEELIYANLKDKNYKIITSDLKIVNDNRTIQLSFEEVSDVPDYDSLYSYIINILGDTFIVKEYYNSTTHQTATSVEYDNTLSELNAANVQTAIDELKQKLDNVYPVGSIYMSTNNVNPSTIFGGVWEKFGQGRVLVGAGESEGRTYNAGDTGGHAETQVASHGHSGSAQSGGDHNHRLEINNGGDHSHTLAIKEVGAGDGGTIKVPSNAPTGTASGIIGSAGYHTHLGQAFSNGLHEHQVIIDESGTTEENGNFPPFMVCHMWTRTE